jgi:hypothetical protein
MRRCLSVLLILLFIGCLIPFVSANPSVSNIYPADGATSVHFDSQPNRIHLRANITNANGSIKYILFETNKTGTWQKIADTNITGNWTTSTYVPFSSLNYSTTYWWRIKAKDSVGNWTNTTAWKFTTVAYGGGGNGTGGVPSGSITIVPSQPKSGGTVIFLISKSNASGYVICMETQNVYPVLFSQGLGSIELGPDYGTAQIFILNYGSKNFTIKHMYEGEIFIDSPYSANINTQVQVSIMAQGVYVPATLYLTSPSNQISSRQAGASGPLFVNFDEAGNWTMRADAFGNNVSKHITVNPDPIAIEVSDDSVVGQEATITVNNNQASVEVKQAETTWTYQADTNGEVFFTPPWSGRYTITATAQNQMGTKTFDVKSGTVISVKNDKGAQISTITEGDLLLIQVQDAIGNAVQSSTLEIYGDSKLLKTLQLSGGSGIWQVTSQAKTYSFSFESDNPLLLSSRAEILGLPPDRTLLYGGIAAVVIIVFVIVLLLNRAGYVNISKLRSLSGGVKDDLL